MIDTTGTNRTDAERTANADYWRRQARKLKEQRDEARAERDALAARLRGIQIYADVFGDGFGREDLDFDERVNYRHHIVEMAATALEEEGA